MRTTYLLRYSPAPPTTGRVSIVAIDERSIAAIGQWPWRRDVIARLVERLGNLGARVVAFDIILSEPDRLGTPPPPARGSPEVLTTTDALLAAALAHHPVVTGYAFTFDASADASSSCVLHALRAVTIEAEGYDSPARHFFRPSGAICSLAAFDQASGASGFLNVSRDPDGVVRRVPLVMEYRQEMYPSLALAAVQHASVTRTVTLSTSVAQNVTLDLAGQIVSIDAHGRLLPRFRRNGAFRVVGASDVLEGRVTPDAFADQIVFVGGTALGISHPVATPLDTALPGVEVHATVADSLLGRTFVSLPAFGGAYDLGAAVAAVLLVAALVTAAGLLWGGVGTAIGCVGLWMFGLWALKTRHTFFSPVLPTVAAAVSLAALTVAKVAQEKQRARTERQRRQRANRFIVESLTSLTEARDVDTGRHVRRTQGYTRIVASGLAKVPRFRRVLTPETIELMAILAPLHDIGKVGIPDAVLNKPGPLTTEEYSSMRAHPRLGYDAIVSAEAASLFDDQRALALAKEMVLTHHEWWDGHGYPQGLAGEQIPIGGRVLAVVDVYDALVGARPYRAPMPHAQAVAAIRAQRGTHFDPDVVDAFLVAERDIEALSQTLNRAA